jgi:hypothetical protein
MLLTQFLFLISFPSQVTVSCKDNQGKDCNVSEPPPGQRAVGADIFTVRFKYTNSSCEEINSQDSKDGFTCDDFNGGPPADTAVLIT